MAKLTMCYPQMHSYCACGQALGSGCCMPAVAGSSPRRRICAAVAATDAWLWLATISSPSPSATTCSTRFTHLHTPEQV